MAICPICQKEYLYTESFFLAVAYIHKIGKDYKISCSAYPNPATKQSEKSLRVIHDFSDEEMGGSTLDTYGSAGVH
jgi:hypothetical protein